MTLDCNLIKITFVIKGIKIMSNERHCTFYVYNYVLFIIVFKISDALQTPFTSEKSIFIKTGSKNWEKFYIDHVKVTLGVRPRAPKCNKLDLLCSGSFGGERRTSGPGITGSMPSGATVIIKNHSPLIRSLIVHLN